MQLGALRYLPLVVIAVAACGPASTPSPTVAPPARSPFWCLDGAEGFRRAGIPEEDLGRVVSTSVELDGRAWPELLLMVGDPDPGANGGSVRAWLIRCGDTALEVVTTARWSFVGASGASTREPLGVRAVSGALASDPFRPLLVQVSSSSGTVAWRRSHAYVLDGATLREVFACLVYFDADTRVDPAPDFDGTVRGLPDRAPGFEVERRYDRSHRARGPLWRRGAYDWNGAGLVARTPDDFCRDDDPAPPDAPMR